MVYVFNMWIHFGSVVSEDNVADFWINMLLFGLVFFDLEVVVI